MVRENQKVQLVKMFVENSNINKEYLYSFDYIKQGVLNISFHYNENCTIKYCKSNIEDLQRFVKILGGNLEFDYEHTTDAPIFTITFE